MTRRLEGRHLMFPPMVYALRKENYIERIGKVIDYATRTDICRSVYLLDYFGETGAAPCGGCDVCCGEERRSVDPRRVAETIAQHLSDGLPHHVSELTLLCTDVPSSVKRQAWDWLVGQECVELRDGTVRLTRPFSFPK